MTSFRALHDGASPLLLPNAWDVPSALAFLAAGYPAIGTTSFGVASSLGRPDGGRSTMAANLALAQALATLPAHISMDIEDGYDDDPELVADYVVELCTAGINVAGINIEDSTAEALVPAQAHAAKVAAIKERLPGLFVNARVDTYWLGQQATVETTLERAAAYLDAGADGIFVPGATEPTTLREITAAVPVPVNVLVIPGLPLAELAELGVRRVSTGSLPYRAAMHAAVEAADAVADGRPIPASVPYPELQARLDRHARTAD